MYSGKKRLRASFSQVDLQFMLSEQPSRSEDGTESSFTQRGLGSMHRMKKCISRADLLHTQKK
jgi:hypothetical protein